jgi:hypothetical protein
MRLNANGKTSQESGTEVEGRTRIRLYVGSTGYKIGKEHREIAKD